MSRTRFIRHHDRVLTPDEEAVVHRLIEAAVEATCPDNKTTNQIFGEIYTRFRADIAMYGAHESLKKLYCSRLKALNGTAAGEILSEMINEIYQSRPANNEAFLDLELCTIMANDCLSEAKQITEVSEEVISNLEQIHLELDGENDV